MDNCKLPDPLESVSSAYQSIPGGTRLRKTVWRGKRVIVQESDQPLSPEQETLRKLLKHVKN